MSRVDSVGLAKQADMGTKQTTMEYFVPVESADIGLSRETIEVEETVGHRFPTDIDYGTGFWEASLSGRARAGSLPRLLSAYLGAPSTSGPTDSAYVHAFDSVAGTPVPHSLLFNRSDPDPAITDLVWDALGNSLTLSVGVNEFMGFEASFIGIDNDDARPEPTVTLDTTPRFVFDEISVSLDDGGGAASVAVASFSMTYSNNLDTDSFVLGSRNLYELKEGNASCEISFTPREALSEHYRRALMATPENVALVLTASGPTIGSGSGYELEISIPKLSYLSAPAAISAADRLTGIEVSARASYDSATSKFVDINLTNMVASY